MAKKETESGSMVRDMDEMKKHGKDMEHHLTNQEIKRTGKQPDPKQHEQ